ncbi:MAG: GntR family transcriptional regulator, transcriptional repressor for pyruvate dehydrogenase complex [Mycobacterium sp.]|nr:GntR family transcriptional regulator, transcriptional repressor for pyruvate dehydrogenase complex [Mycobacterium sp.]
MEAPKPATHVRSGLKLSPVDVPKASDVLAGQLRERILTANRPKVQHSRRSANW